MIKAQHINTILAVVLLVTLSSFVTYYVKTQKEINEFHLEIEKSIQEQINLEAKLAVNELNLKQAIENQDLMVSQIETLTKEGIVVHNEMLNIRGKVLEAFFQCVTAKEKKT
jgi:hypothetical protein